MLLVICISCIYEIVYMHNSICNSSKNKNDNGYLYLKIRLETKPFNKYILPYSVEVAIKLRN